METRVANWPAVLNQKVDEWRLQPFAWGTADCCQFAAEVVAALTGTDRRGLFPVYASREEAEVILAEHGGITGLATHALGQPKPVAWANRGDVVVADFGAGPAIGICVGVNSCAPGERGLVFRRTATAQAAWSV